MARNRGVSQPTVWGWIHRIGHLPVEHVLGVETATGIPKEDLRPDIYPRDAASPAVPSGVAPGGAGENTTPSRAGSAADDQGRTPDSLSGLTA